jgi:CheY-like chemotaxis protein
MRLLIAEDDPLFRNILVQILSADYEIMLAHDGDEAWALLQAPGAPRLAILDWVMPGLSGPQVCRQVRACAPLSSTYLIILTSKNSQADIVSGLRAGADDYITKPFLTAELRARVRIGERVLSLQAAVERQSAVAHQLLGRESLLRSPLTNCPLLKHLPTQSCVPALEEGTELSLDLAGCCPETCAETGLPVNRPLTPSPENLHSKH